MWFRYKILTVPIIVFCLAVFFLIAEKPIQLEKTTVSKGLPFPPQKESKTDLTKANWSTKVSKSDSSFHSVLIKNNIYSPSVRIILFSGPEIFYTSNFFTNHSGRAPPIIS